ncbi:MAG: hypothetical protein JWO99_285 [Candidatus Saccharibacteria bacterium]|nr:hypothetical protein [Candidatus Saccharibacteria bacterium]
MTLVVSPEVNTYSEVTLPKNTTEPTTDSNEVIVRGTDEYLEQPEQTKTYEQIVEEGVEAQYGEFKDWLNWRVKNELVAQIFHGLGQDNLQLNIGSVRDVIRKEMTSQRDHHFQSATHIDTTVVPLAKMRPEAQPDIPGYYWQKDVPNLEARSEIHLEVSERISQFAMLDETALYDLSEKYIRELNVEAQKEALTIAVQKIKDLEEQERKNKLEMVDLKSVAAVLAEQLKKAEAHIADRDIELHEYEMTTPSVASEQLAA